MAVPLKSALAALTLVILALTSLSLAQTSPQTLAPHAEYGHEPDPSSGNISGTVVDQSGAVVAGARVTLTGPTAIPATIEVVGDPKTRRPLRRRRPVLFLQHHRRAVPSHCHLQRLRTPDLHRDPPLGRNLHRPEDRAFRREQHLRSRCHNDPGRSRRSGDQS